MDAIIVVTHGSRRREFLEDLEAMAESLRRDIKGEVILAHNEFSPPDWRDVVRKLSERGFTRIIFALAFLGRGNHVFKDIAGSLNVDELEKWTKVNIGGKEIEVYFTRPLADSVLVHISLKLRVMRALGLGVEGYLSDPEEIEERSMDIAEEHARKIRPDLHYPHLRIVARAVYATGNPEIAMQYYSSDEAVNVAVEALRAGITVVTDVRMVACGLRWKKVVTAVEQSGIEEEVRRNGGTKTAAGIRLSLKVGEPRAVIVGNAPTALLEVLKLVSQGREIPFVIASPPGFTNAMEAKESLVKSGLPSFVIRGSYGGSNVAAAIFNELIRLAGD